MRKLVALLALLSTGALAQTTVVTEQDFGVIAPAVQIGIAECPTSSYTSGDCYVVKEGVLFVFNDELDPSPVKKVEMQDGYYHQNQIENTAL